MNASIAVLGAGMAGLAAANTLRNHDCVIYEARANSGGHASSFYLGDYTFDEGPHISFTSDRRVEAFLARSVNQQFNTHSTKVNNLYQGHTAPHPIQSNLYGFPPQWVRLALASFICAQYENRTETHSYKDWCYRTFGEVITETFTRVYMRKYWTRELEQITTCWVQGRIHTPTIEQMISGAIAASPQQQHYMTQFRYPKQGGFAAYNTLLTARASIEYNHTVYEINPGKKQLSFHNGSTAHYDFLISSLPLPVLVACLPTAPTEVVDAAKKLTCTSHLIVSLGVKRPALNAAHWICVYDEDIPFSRVSFPSSFAESVAPTGYSSVQLEVVHSKYKPLPAQENIAELSIDGLLRCGILNNRHEIDTIDVRNIAFANVVFDFDREPNLAIIHRYLHDTGIVWCGRYGDWAYHWTDQSMLSGERAANQVLAKLGLPSAEFI